MKHRRCGIGLLMAAALAFSACAAPAPGSAAPSAESSGESPAFPPASQGALRLLVDGNGISAAEFSGTEDGCYWIRMNTNDSANIFYMDYKSAQRVFLSEQMGGNHNDETDTSFIKDAYGGCIPIVDECRLWLLKFGAGSLIGSLGERAMPALYRCDLNGANREKFFSLAEDELFSSTSGVAAEGKALYLMLERPTCQEMVLIRVDKETGGREELAVMPFPDRYSIVDVAGDFLVIKHTSFPGAGKSPTGKQKTETQTYAIELFSRSGQGWSTVKVWKPLEFRCTTADGNLFLWDPADHSLKKRPLGEEGQEELVCCFPQEDRFFDGIRFVGGGFDGHVFMGVANSEKDEYHVYGIDTATGEITPIDQNKDGTIRGVVAENATQFLVTGEAEIVPIADMLQDGTPITIESMEPNLFLVDKKEYWAGRQQGSPIITQ